MTTALNTRTLTRVQRCGVDATMADFSEAFAAQDFYGRQPRTELRRDMAVFFPWMGRAAQASNAEKLPGGSRRIRRTYGQIVDGVDGWEREATYGETVAKYRDAIRNRLDLLVRIGWIEHWGGIRAANGEGECVAIVLTPAGVAQSVRTAESRDQRRRRRRGPQKAPQGATGPPGTAHPAGGDERGSGRVSNTEIVHPRPADHSAGSSLSSPCRPRETAVGAGALRASAHKARTAWARRAEAELAARAAAVGNDEAGVRIVEALPWLADVAVEQPAALARAAIRAYGSDLPQTLSARWRSRMELAVRRLDRYAAFGRSQHGVAAALILDLVRAEPLTVTYAGARPTEARSLGAVALALWQTANTWRAHDRWRTGRRAGFSPPEARGRDNHWHRWRGGPARRRPRGTNRGDRA